MYLNFLIRQPYFIRGGGVGIRHPPRFFLFHFCKNGHIDLGFFWLLWTLCQKLNCLPGPHGRQRHPKVGRGRQK